MSTVNAMPGPERPKLGTSDTPVLAMLSGIQHGLLSKGSHQLTTNTL